ncbi:MAG: glycosyltransferase [Saprospiraceae bacterium]
MNNTRKIIALVTNDLIQDQRMHRVCSALHEKGYNVTLVGKKSQQPISKLGLGFKTLRLSFMFKKGFLFYLETIFRYFFLLMHQRPHLVWAVDTDTIIPSIIFKKFYQSKVIFDAHEYFHEVPELNKKPLKKWIWKKVGNIFIPKANAHITVGHALADILTKEYNRHFNVLRNVPVIKDVSSSKSTEKKYILYQGVLNEGRGLEILISAMQKIKELELWIAGEGDLSNLLRMKAATSTQRHRINFLGWMIPEELEKITRNAYLGINILSSDSLSYRYSLANKFFDYIHAEVPSVNMNYPEYAAILKEWPVGIMVDILNEDEIADAINNLNKNENKYAILKENTKRAKINFHWGKEKSILNDILASIGI